MTTPPPAVPLPEVIAFLLGEDAIYGYHYGDRGGGMPPYWWRKQLRAAWEQHQSAIAADREADARDAARYRWLRDESKWDTVRCIIYGENCDGAIDAAIDAAVNGGADDAPPAQTEVGG